MARASRKGLLPYSPSMQIDRPRAFLPQRRDGVCSFLHKRPHGIDLRPHLFPGIPCRIDVASTDLRSILNSVGSIPIVTAVPLIARILGGGFYQYSIQTSLGRLFGDGPESLSLWTSLDCRGFKDHPSARHTLFLAVSSAPRYAAMALAYEISRILDRCVYRHGLENKPTVLAFAHAINGFGAWAFLLLDERGHFAQESELHVDALRSGFIQYHGYDVIAHPPKHLHTLDASSFDDLVTVRRFLVERRALHPSMRSLLCPRIEPVVSRPVWSGPLIDPS